MDDAAGPLSEKRVLARRSAGCQPQILLSSLRLDRRCPGLELIAEVAQSLQAPIDVEKSRLATHRVYPPTVTAGIESKSQRFGDGF